MKTIRLTPQQRNDISERRRQAQDRRIYQRLSAVLWSDAGRTREEIAELVGDPGRLRPAQVERLKQEIATGAFHNAEQVRTWVQETWGVAYSISGLKDLLRRIGASYHKVSGFFGKADVQEQKDGVRKDRRRKREAGP